MAVTLGVLQQQGAQPMLLEGADIAVDTDIGGGARGAGDDEQSRLLDQCGEGAPHWRAAFARDRELRLAIGIDRGDQRQLAIGQAGDDGKAPAGQPDRAGRDEANRQAGRTSKRADPRLLIAAALPQCGQPRALLGEGHAEMACDLAKHVDPGEGVGRRCGGRTGRQGGGGHSVTPRTVVPVSLKSSRARPE